MIFPESKLEIADNSGGLKARCIKILNGSKRKGAGMGSLIIISVIKALPNKKVSKKQIHKAIIIRTKQ